MLQRLIGEDIDLDWVPGEDLWQVRIDPSQIDQVLANLCVNARDAISGYGKMTIETANVSIDEEYCSHHAGFKPGNYIMLAISDNGRGMDNMILKNIFEPFFTTKEKGEGSGFGLSTVYGIIRQNDGLLNVYSEPNRGSTFKIYLPRHKTDAVSLYPHNKPDSLIQGSETILLVEDETAILEITTLMLESQGYNVLPAATPEEAIELATNDQNPIHLLVTDVVMPEMTGRELEKILSASNPGMKCLYMSGYTANVIAHHGVLDEGINYIQKPFLSRTLAAKVREVLDKA